MHLYDSALGKVFSKKDGLNPQEVILQHTGERVGATFFGGSKPINGLWVSSDLDISKACVMTFVYGVGDHWAFILDIPLESLMGENPIKNMRPSRQRLNSQLPWYGDEYAKKL